LANLGRSSKEEKNIWAIFFGEKFRLKLEPNKLKKMIMSLVSKKIAHFSVKNGSKSQKILIITLTSEEQKYCLFIWRCGLHT
jgi:hypothetical protein